MTAPQNFTRLQQCLADMVALETRNEDLVDQVVTQLQGPSEATQTVRAFQTLVKGQRKALQARLHDIGGGGASPTGSIAPLGMTDILPDKGDAYAVSKTLNAIHTTFNHAAFGYGMLHAMGHRFFDGETADLAEAHLRGYTGATQEVNQLIADVVVWELTRDGLDCRCGCPSCALGVCV